MSSPTQLIILSSFVKVFIENSSTLISGSLSTFKNFTRLSRGRLRMFSNFEQCELIGPYIWLLCVFQYFYFDKTLHFGTSEIEWILEGFNTLKLKCFNVFLFFSSSLLHSFFLSGYSATSTIHQTFSTSHRTCSSTSHIPLSRCKLNTMNLKS